MIQDTTEIKNVPISHINKNYIKPIRIHMRNSEYIDEIMSQAHIKIPNNNNLEIRKYLYSILCILESSVEYNTIIDDSMSEIIINYVYTDDCIIKSLSLSILIHITYEEAPILSYFDDYLINSIIRMIPFPNSLTFLLKASIYSSKTREIMEETRTFEKIPMLLSNFYFQSSVLKEIIVFSIGGVQNALFEYPIIGFLKKLYMKTNIISYKDSQDTIIKYLNDFYTENELIDISQMVIERYHCYNRQNPSLNYLTTVSLTNSGSKYLLSIGIENFLEDCLNMSQSPNIYLPLIKSLIMHSEEHYLLLFSHVFSETFIITFFDLEEYGTMIDVYDILILILSLSSSDDAYELIQHFQSFFALTNIVLQSENKELVNRTLSTLIFHMQISSIKTNQFIVDLNEFLESNEFNETIGELIQSKDPLTVSLVQSFV